MKNTTEPIVVTQTYPASAAEVWNAITRLDEMRQWFFDNIPEFKAETGFETKFNVKTPEREFMHLWKLTEVEPLKKITYRWRYENYPGEGHVTFDLTDQGRETLLTLTSTGMETFPAEIPEFTRESCLNGWKYFIEGRLKEYMEKKQG